MEKDLRSDEELVYLAHMHDEAALEELIRRYNHWIYPLILKRRTSAGFLDMDEALQVARIGLIRAVEGFRTDRPNRFAAFAIQCADNELVGLIRREASKGLYSNGRCISLDTPIVEDEKLYLSDTITDPRHQNEPDRVFHNRELAAAVEECMAGLPELQQKIFRLWSEGSSYKEIADALGITTKKVDYSIQYIKMRLRRHVDE